MASSPSASASPPPPRAAAWTSTSSRATPPWATPSWSIWSPCAPIPRDRERPGSGPGQLLHPAPAQLRQGPGGLAHHRRPLAGGVAVPGPAGHPVEDGGDAEEVVGQVEVPVGGRDGSAAGALAVAGHVVRLVGDL